MGKCLCCYKELPEGVSDFHPKCANRFFGSKIPPAISYSHSDIKLLAKEVVRTRTTVPGVQSKLSMDLQRVQNEQRLTIVGLWGRYILKPQTPLYRNLPELEDVTMHLAESVKISTVPHTLVRFADGLLCYLTQRIDRTAKGEKIPMEDFCQLSGKLTEHKYRGSYEQIAKGILRFSAAPQLDLVNFWEVVLFSWFTGNSDMHLKNFSLFSPHNDGYILAPAYDLLNTLLVLPSDSEELALTLNGKKMKITRSDFEIAMCGSGLNPKVIANLLGKYEGVLEKWEQFISDSFLPQNMQNDYCELLRTRHRAFYK